MCFQVQSRMCKNKIEKVQFNLEYSKTTQGKMSTSSYQINKHTRRLKRIIFILDFLDYFGVIVKISLKIWVVTNRANNMATSTK